MSFPDALKRLGLDVDTGATARATASRDASIFEVRPEAVFSPRDPLDISAAIKLLSARRSEFPNTSLTARAAGTDMSGGPLTESIVVDFVKHGQGVKSIDTAKREAVVLPGTYYRDFEKRTLAEDLILPSYTASKELCTVGGMVANNSGGEKTLKYGKTEKYVKSLKVILFDGNEYEIKPLTKDELASVLLEATALGEVYRHVHEMLERHGDLIRSQKPNVTKNSAGYGLWNIEYDGLFDLTQLFVGSQGTLGFVTEITFALEPVKKFSKLLVMYVDSLDDLASLTTTLLPFTPESLEVYDDQTMKLAMRYFRDVVRLMKGTTLLHLIVSFTPEFFMILTGGVPKLVMLAEFAGDDEGAVDALLLQASEAVKPLGVRTRMARTQDDVGKYWTIRRESFSLLRKHIHGKRTAPFVDDVIIDPLRLPEFLPRLRTILDEYHLLYTIAGHDGNGNLHIIPLMDMKDPGAVETVMAVSEKVFSLVAEFGGSITGEHNDGIIRTPYLHKMYSPEMLALFAETKKIFDPLNIFNPGKKVGGTLDFLKAHIVRE